MSFVIYMYYAYKRNMCRYNTEWYNMPIAQRKLIMMIMMRSKKLLRITAGNIIILSYVNFKAVSKSNNVVRARGGGRILIKDI